ncbi:hypothetical protein JCM17478_35770 [Thermopirellula anaerolimosa]
MEVLITPSVLRVDQINGGIVLKNLHKSVHCPWQQHIIGIQGKDKITRGKLQAVVHRDVRSLIFLTKRYKERRREVEACQPGLNKLQTSICGPIVDKDNLQACVILEHKPL